MENKLKTYGDLKKLIKDISLKQKGEKVGDVALGTLIGFFPGADIAKTTFDFIKAAYRKPDTKKTKTWLDKLDIDDDTIDIVDDTIENGFLKDQAKKFDSESDDKPLEDDFNMNARLIKYIEDKHNGRTITGIKENKSKNKNKMKNEALKKLIKEEILSMLEVDAAAAAPAKNAPSEVVNLIKYLQGTGKTPLSQINSPSELKQILDTIFVGMNPAMMKNAGVLSVKKIIDMKL
jgi:hypothetical protein